MPRKKSAPKAVTVHLVDPSLDSQVRVLKLPAVQPTWGLRWVDPVTREADSARFHEVDLAISEADKLAARMRDGLTPHIGRAARAAASAGAREPVARRKTVAHTLLTVEEKWASKGFEGKPQSLAGARLNLELYVYREYVLWDATGQPTDDKICLAKLALEDIRRHHIVAWDRSMARTNSRLGTPFSSSTRALALRNLNSLLNFAVKKGYIPANPSEGYAVDLYDVKPVDSFRTQEDFFRVIKYLPDWAKAPIIVLAYTGARYGEGAALAVSALDLTNNRIYFKRTLLKDGNLGTTKTVASQDFVPYHPSLTPILAAHKESLHQSGPDDRLFPGQRRGQSLQNTSLNRLLKAACEKAGLDIRVTCHGLRHSLASWLNHGGADIATIQMVLRHKQIKTTRDYIHIHEEDRVQAMDNLAAIPPGILD